MLNVAFDSAQSTRYGLFYDETAPFTERSRSRGFVE